MHRTIPVLFAGGLLLTAAACGTAPASPAAGGSAPAAAPSVDPALADTCQALSTAYGANMAPLAQALTELSEDPAKKAQAQKALSTFAIAIRNATQGSGDEQLRAAGKKAADDMTAKSKDATFFATIKSSADVDKTLGPTMTTWLAPVQKRCS